MASDEISVPSLSKDAASDPAGLEATIAVERSRQSKRISPSNLRIAGTGSFIPPNVVSNEQLAGHLKKKSSQWIDNKLGIRERRFATALDGAGIKITAVDEVGMAFVAGMQALEAAHVEPKEVEALFYITCTPESDKTHFMAVAMELRERLALSETAYTQHTNAGCGGTLHALSLARALVNGGMNNILIVASNAPSKFFERNWWNIYGATEAWLSALIFGDGAGAFLIQRSPRSGVKDSTIIGMDIRVDPSNPLMHYRRKSGTTEHVFDIDARSVAMGLASYIPKVIDSVLAQTKHQLGEIDHFFFHQVNGVQLRRFCEFMKIPLQKVHIHVDRYGNIAAASIPVLVDEAFKSGQLKRGDLCLFAAIGAGAQYGSILLRF